MIKYRKTKLTNKKEKQIKYQFNSAAGGIYFLSRWAEESEDSENIFKKKQCLVFKTDPCNHIGHSVSPRLYFIYFMHGNP